VQCPHAGRSRREFVGLLGAGLAVTMAGCGAHDPHPPAGTSADGSHLPEPDEASVEPGADPGTDPVHPGSPAPKITGVPQILTRGSASGRRIVLTVDDGFCADCVAGYVAFVKRSGVHLTFCPNGIYAREWEPHAPVLRPLIEAGQIQLMNHTYDHRDLTTMPAAAVRADLDRNEAWIEKTFGTTTRPYYRPPYGRHNAQVQQAAAAGGYRLMTLWNGSLSDSKLITPEFLMGQANKYLRAGTILIGHANHPTVLGLFDQILDLIKQRELDPVTLDEMFGTARPQPRR
jgi:peptidoglycan/xylan/chitin deacetylase (PgdA/CDA1 family)